MRTKFTMLLCGAFAYSLSFGQVMVRGQAEKTANRYTLSEAGSFRSVLPATVTGKVTDEDGVELPGVSIQVKGTTRGVSTTVDGTYSIDAQSTDILVFSFIGYMTEEIAVGTQSVINVTLLPDIKQLQEVVVVGYGTQQSKDISSSVSIISAEDAKDNPIPSIEGIIQGRAAGVNISQNTGIPGQGMSVLIRGATSISASSQPLYVVDGIPMVSESNSALFTGGYTANSMADLNPGDIESISVLKDAAATAIYGSRGANGVILITTKRGKSGKPNINLNYYTGINQPTRVVEMLDSREFINMLDEAAANDGLDDAVNFEGDKPVNEEDKFSVTDGKFFSEWMGIGDPDDPELNYTNWLDEIFQNGKVSNYELTAQGGNEAVRYYVGGSYHSNEGYLLNSNFDRFSGRVNLDVKATEKLNFGSSIALSRTNQFRPISDNSLYGGPINAQAADPTMPVFESDGSYADPFVYWSWWAFENPRAATDIYQRESFTNRALASIFAEVEIIEGLTFRSSWSVDYKTLKDKSFIPSIAAQSFRNDTNGEGFYATYEDYTYTVENYFTYDKTFGDHKLSANLIQSVQQADITFTSIAGQGYALDNLPNLALASDITGGSMDGTNWGIQSLALRANYSFRDKYIFSATVRRDGSSRFGTETRYGTFPAVSAAWRISDEAFMENSNLFSDLKLRVSYGLTGNQEGIDNFASRALWGTGAAYLQTGAAVPTRLGNGNLGWESTASFDVGLDMAFWNNRIQVTADYYDKQTSDLLLSAPVTALSGFAAAIQNLGAMQNRGFELGINSVNIDNAGGGFTWETNFNIAMNRNQIKTLVNDSTRIGETHILIEGQPLGTYFMPKFNGVDPQTGDALYDDLDGSGFIDADDSQVLGSIQPDFFGGITNKFTFRNFDLSVFLQYMIGHEIYNQSRHSFENGGFAQRYGSSIFAFLLPYGNISQQSYDERWQNPGDITRVPRLSTGWEWDTNSGRWVRKDPQFVERSSQFVEDGSFLRVKNVTLGYTMPSSIMSKIKGINSIRIYVQGQNLGIITSYLGQDPEANSTGQSVTAPGIDFGSLGPARTLIGGINIGL